MLKRKQRIEDVLLATTATEYSRFFCCVVKTIKPYKGITNVRTLTKVMPCQISYNGSAGGVFRVMPSSGGISPLTCTIFDSTYFGGILKNHVFHISPTRLNNFIMGNYFDFDLKIEHRGNPGSYRGKKKSFFQRHTPQNENLFNHVLYKK